MLAILIDIFLLDYTFCTDVKVNTAWEYTIHNTIIIVGIGCLVIKLPMFWTKNLCWVKPKVFYNELKKFSIFMKNYFQFIVAEHRI